MAERTVSPERRIVTRAEALASGEKHYFTGKPCKRGHVAPRFACSSTCRDCWQEQGRAWKATNRDKINAAEREARLRNPEACKARTDRYIASDKGKATRRAYYEANAETIRLRTREWAEQNPGRARESQQAWYEANKEKAKQRARDWSAANPEAARARGRNYRARVNGAEGAHTAADIKAIHDKQRGRCAYCRKALGKKFQVDHIKPLSRGGSNDPANLQLTCAPCNNRKRATDPVEFARRLGLLV